MNSYKLSRGSSISLDLIRGMSAQVVVLGHNLSKCQFWEKEWLKLEDAAVLVFFLLSGFLITYTIFKNRAKRPDYDFRYFTADRFSRIYTAFLPAIIFVLLIDSINISLTPKNYIYYEALNVKTLIGNLLMLQDFPIFRFLPFDVTSLGSARPFWTLAIEWWIYLFIGYLILKVGTNKKTSLLQLIVLAFFAITPVYNLVNGRGNGLMVFWLFGLVIYFLERADLLPKINHKFKGLLSLGFFGLAILRLLYTNEVYDPTFAFILAISLYLFIDISKKINYSQWWEKVIRYIASYSYTLYLIHFSILVLLRDLYRDTLNPYILFMLGFILSNALSILIGRYTEIKLTKQVKRVLYQQIEKKASVKEV